MKRTKLSATNEVPRTMNNATRHRIVQNLRRFDLGMVVRSSRIVAFRRPAVCPVEPLRCFLAFTENVLCQLFSDLSGDLRDMTVCHFLD
jgi:hypothetical protein